MVGCLQELSAGLPAAPLLLEADCYLPAETWRLAEWQPAALLLVEAGAEQLSAAELAPPALARQVVPAGSRLHTSQLRVCRSAMRDSSRTCCLPWCWLQRSTKVLFSAALKASAGHGTHQHVFSAAEHTHAQRCHLLAPGAAAARGAAACP